MNFGMKEFSQTPMPLTLRLDVGHRALQTLSSVPMANLSDYVESEHVEVKEDIPLQSMNSDSKSTAKQVFTMVAIVQGVEKAKGVSFQLYSKTSSADLSQR